MATSTFDTYEAKGMKESFSDLIFNISPTETPFLSMIGTTTSKQRLHQWQKDTLDSPALNVQAEGDGTAASVTIGATTATTVDQNYCQISTKVFGVSGTLEVTEKYGRDSSMAYQTAKAARSLKTDVDFTMTGSVQEAILSTGGPPGDYKRASGALPCWLGTNFVTTNDGVAPVGSNGTNAPTNGTVAAFTQSHLDTCIQDAWVNGGKPSVILAGGAQKTNISGFDGVTGTALSSGNSTMRTDRATKTITATADMYISNFGDLRIVPSRHIYDAGGAFDRTVFVIDPELFKFAVLRPWQQFDLAKTGDTINRELLVEWTLQSSNEAGSGQIADCAN